MHLKINKTKKVTEMKVAWVMTNLGNDKLGCCQQCWVKWCKKEIGQKRFFGKQASYSIVWKNSLFVRDCIFIKPVHTQEKLRPITKW